MQARVAATAAGKSFHVEMNGTNISGSITVPNTTGWQTWQTVPVTTTALTVGQKTMRIVMDTDGFNLNYLNFIIPLPVVAPVVSSNGTANGAVAAAFTYTITASSSPTSYNATNLPAGLSVSTSTGIISGTPTTAGTYTVTISATNGIGTGNKSLVLTIAALPICNGSIIVDAASVPTIDGTIDAVWAKAPTNTITKIVNGNNNKTNTYTANDFQYGFNWGVAANTTNMYGTNSANARNGIVYAIPTVNGGYNLEVKIPWTTLGVTPSNGKPIGFDIQVNDDDSGSPTTAAPRNATGGWFTTATNAYADPSVFGTVNLTVCTNNNMPLVTDCPNTTASYIAATPTVGNIYQWQLNTGNGYTNINNSSLYAGVTTDTLVINNTPTSLYGYKYRSVITNNSVVTYSAENTIKFTETWTGAISTAWENAGNWSCGIVPDSNTDVIINSGSVIINSAASVRSLRLNPSVQLTLNTGNTLTITH
ncbi:MAG: carbohydrate-binding protein [Sphingobacteriales bacterium]|nr:carbohydrate-binding protein [Sphingobacteriales bacterium]